MSDVSIVCSVTTLTGTRAQYIIIITRLLTSKDRWLFSNRTL
ncbi:hypothetical protein [Niallia sp. 03133]